MDAINVIPLDWFRTTALLIAVVFIIIILSYFFSLGNRIRHRFEKWKNRKVGKTEVTGKCPECGKDAVLCLGCGRCKDCCIMEIGRGTNVPKENPKGNKT